MLLRRWTRDTRLAFAMRNPARWRKPIPDAPAQTLRDPWPGNPTTGERLIHNQTQFEGVTRTLQRDVWDNPSWPASYRQWLQSFEWLRDLRELGVESARIKARNLVLAWISIPAAERPVSEPSVTGSRITAWLSYYDFFAAAADESFRLALMTAIIMEGRSIIALMPEGADGWQALTAMKGLLGAAIALPFYSEFLTCYLKLSPQLISAQFLSDGSHITRNPSNQLQAVKELAEILSFHQTARIPASDSLARITDSAVAALRAMRHSDGGLIVFNGSTENDPGWIEHVLNRASRSRIMAASLTDSGYTRFSSGRALLIADTATCAPSGHDRSAHAGMLSFEFSSGKDRIIVNCGASNQPGWTNVLRQTAAHSVLDFKNLSPVEMNAYGTIISRPEVTCAHAAQNGAFWLQMTHNGFQQAGGGLYTRLLYLGADGQTLRGEESLPGGTRTDFCIRFHLHPDITVEKTNLGFLLHTDEESWLFQSDALIAIEESVYLGKTQRQPTLQIILTPFLPQPENEAPHASVKEADSEATTAAVAPDKNTQLIPETEEPALFTENDVSPQDSHEFLTSPYYSSLFNEDTLQSDSAGMLTEPTDDDYTLIPRDPPPADSIPTLMEGITHLQHNTTQTLSAAQAERERSEAVAAWQARRIEKEREYSYQTSTPSADFLSDDKQLALPCPPIRWALTLVSEP